MSFDIIRIHDNKFGWGSNSVPETASQSLEGLLAHEFPGDGIVLGPGLCESLVVFITRSKEVREYLANYDDLSDYYELSAEDIAESPYDDMVQKLTQLFQDDRRPTWEEVAQVVG